MSEQNEQQEEQQNMTTILVHLDNAADKIGHALKEFTEGRESAQAVEDAINEASPNMESVGVKLNDDSTTVNQKPVPENPQGVVYFYTDDDGTLRATVRLPRHDDNETLKDAETAYIGELAACEVVRLVNMEHQRVIEQVALSMAAQQVGGFGDESGDEDDPLSTIEDDDTREQVRRVMKH